MPREEAEGADAVLFTLEERAREKCWRIDIWWVSKGSLKLELLYWENMGKIWGNHEE